MEHRVKTFHFLAVSFLALSYGLHSSGQALSSTGTALVADVRPSPYRASINYTVSVGEKRFDIHNATAVNLIDFANGREDDDGRDDADIVGGPSWLDLDRFDVAGVLPQAQHQTGTSAPAQRDRSEQLRPLIRRVLAERFHVTSHTAERSLPGYVVTVAKGGSKLTESSDQTAANECRDSSDAEQAGVSLTVCMSEPFTDFLHNMAPTFKFPLVDRTGLAKRYDFTLEVKEAQVRTRADLVQAATEGLEKLGIVITLGNVPQRSTVIDTAVRPGPTSPEIVKQIAALPDPEFEVASIKLANEMEPRSKITPAGSQIVFGNFSMQELLVLAWQLPTGAMLGSAPSWVDSTRYTIRAKLPPGLDAHAAAQDQDEVARMLQKLLIERFGVKSHRGEHELDGWILAGGIPKMKRAEATSRSFCKYGPPAGERDMRAGGSAFNGEFHCQNVSMAQFADLLQPMARSEIKNRVVDQSGLSGSYDFRVFYTSARKLMSDAAAMNAASAADLPSDQTIGYSIEDAFRTQLGLKLTKRRGLYPALILDHIEQTPTEN